jgi:hypothetical protein
MAQKNGFSTANHANHANQTEGRNQKGSFDANLHEFSRIFRATGALVFSAEGAVM